MFYLWICHRERNSILIQTPRDSKQLKIGRKGCHICRKKFRKKFPKVKYSWNKLCHKSYIENCISKVILHIWFVFINKIQDLYHFTVSKGLESQNSITNLWDRCIEVAADRNSKHRNYAARILRPVRASKILVHETFKKGTHNN